MKNLISFVIEIIAWSINLHTLEIFDSNIKRINYPPHEIIGYPPMKYWFSDDFRGNRRWT